MAKELYLYTGIYDFTAEALMTQIDENMDEPIELNTLCQGGSVFAAYGIYDKLKKHGDVNLKVQGAIMSAAAFLPLYCKSSEILNVARVVFHRADLFVSNEKQQEYLNGINKDLKALMLKRIKADKWLEVTETTIEELFNPDGRIDVILTGAEAVEVGLFDKLTKLTPEIQKQITAFNEGLYNVAAHSDPPPTKTKKIMTIAELKVENAALYNEVFALGQVDGVKAEKERIEAWTQFIAVDAKAVNDGIASGKVMTQAQTIDLMTKKFSAGTVEAIKRDSAGNVIAEVKTEVEKTKEEKDKADFIAGVRANTTTFKTEVK